MLIKNWVKNKFLTIFNEFYKIANLLQREETRGVESSIQSIPPRSLHTPNERRRNPRWSISNPESCSLLGIKSYLL